MTPADIGSDCSSKDSTRPSPNVREKKKEEMAVAVCLERLLAEKAERVGRKAHLKPLTAGWDRVVGIVAEDVPARYCLTFSGGGVACTAWQEPVHLEVRGRARDLAMLFGSDELAYQYAKQQVSTKGRIGDRLKLEALLRLSG
ncbi:SCP-2 sterol transfer family protein [Brevibacillus sp. WF146]|uniref:SCP-2 sterol transfer family protein n=1 Tax=Brevibacillus sp. WF146 TaxID=319501 RepID=UPI000A5EED9F|nr:SCP-2 sterol transfer family protein [Brevibacillus sp. WF146]UYZ14257.1 SCP-2 sterol transfer family protein [Brevibacillus sp. WF146]